LNKPKETVKTEVSRSKGREVDLSSRQTGVRQGVMLMLLSVILIPAYILLGPLFPANDRLVEGSVSDTPFEKISQAVLLTIFILGLARVLYARLFQQGPRLREEVGETEVAQLKASARNELPPAQSIPVSGFGSWRTDTGEMAYSQSAREHTTKSLDRD